MTTRLTTSAVCMLLLFAAGNTSAQNAGFYGRKVFVEVHTASQYPLLNLWLNSAYESTTEKKDRFNTSVNFVIGGAVSRGASLSVESGLFFGSFTANATSYNSLFKSHENYDFRTLTIMPRIEVAGQGGNAPGGLSHQFGIGFTLSKVVRKDYDYVLSDAPYYSYEIDPEDAALNYEQRYKGISLMYAIIMRTPITKRLLFNYGLRYNVNIPVKKTGYYYDDEYWISDYATGNKIATTRLLSIISFQAGLTFTL